VQRRSLATRGDARDPQRRRKSRLNSRGDPIEHRRRVAMRERIRAIAMGAKILYAQ
jgi:hypothetical protein